MPLAPGAPHRSIGVLDITDESLPIHHGRRIERGAQLAASSGRPLPIAHQRGGDLDVLVLGARDELRKPGVYRLQYRFKGSSLVLGGKITEAIRIRRSIRFG